MRVISVHRVKPTAFLVDIHPLAVRYLRFALQSLTRVRAISENELRSCGGNNVYIFDRASLGGAIARHVETLRAHIAQPKIIVIDEDCSNEEQFRFLSLGIQGLVRYRDVRRTLAPAVMKVANGGLWIGSEILAEYISCSRREFVAEQGSHGLTHREVQVLQLVQRKLSNKEISSALTVSESTVKFHLANIFEKLGVRTRESAVEKAEAISPRGAMLTMEPESAGDQNKAPKLIFSVKSA